MSILENDDLQEQSFKGLHDILINLLDSSNSLEMKTEVHNASALACLKAISRVYKKRNLTLCSDVLKKWIFEYLELMVSHKREARKEIVEALQSLQQKQESLSTFKDKLLQKVD